MENNEKNRKKKASIGSDGPQTKCLKRDEQTNSEKGFAGKVKKIRVYNFMCHEAFEIVLNENVNFIVGCNGSGKSAILTALTIGLGAEANVTSRGTSVKEFKKAILKKGKTSASIEITLTNAGNNAYKHATFGDIIIVVRMIEANTSSYEIKNWRGDVISTKREELNNIIATFGIQIDNPICVLNQDVARTFLTTTNPQEKYNLFMRATQLDTIENIYKEALEMCEEEYLKLNKYSETLAQVKKDIEKLKTNIHTVEKLDKTRDELNNLEVELCWATAITEEAKLCKVRETLKMHESDLKDLENVELTMRTKNEEIDGKIKELEEKIQQAEKEVIDSGEAYNRARQKHTAAREAHSNKQCEWRCADQIKELMQKKKRHRHEYKRATWKLQEIKQIVQYATGIFEIQERITLEAISDATTKRSRINTTRSVNQIKNLANELRDKIREVEHQYGCVDNLRQQLKEKEEKFGADIEFESQLRQRCEKHNERVKYRLKMFNEIRELYGIYIQNFYTALLSLRQYNGTVVIDHKNKLLDLHISARDAKNNEIQKDSRMLSGGERSYSTVVFFVALWDCIKMPFYFLDEFDVFMDNVNRSVIMDILLDHTKFHPQSQFIFITPFETSLNFAEDYITIHQLQSPERSRKQ